MIISYFYYILCADRISPKIVLPHQRKLCSATRLSYHLFLSRNIASFLVQQHRYTYVTNTLCLIFLTGSTPLGSMGPLKNYMQQRIHQKNIYQQDVINHLELPMSNITRISRFSNIRERLTSNAYFRQLLCLMNVVRLF